MTLRPWQWMLLPLRRYADFKGRAGRREYWWYAPLPPMLNFLANAALWNASNTAGVLANLALWLALLTPTLAVTTRRLHDTGRRGWWQALPLAVFLAYIGFTIGFVSLVETNNAGGITFSIFVVLLSLAVLASAVTLLVWLLLPSQPGSNRFGPNPYDEGNIADDFA
ncbi:MAG: DUF805 domain-containing protein [Sphingomonadales bacterium]|jgi:uncharacterized membrane protein YhaH (DUF805 family)